MKEGLARLRAWKVHNNSASEVMHRGKTAPGPTRSRLRLATFLAAITPVALLATLLVAHGNAGATVYSGSLILISAPQAAGTQANSGSYGNSITANGRLVAFQSNASNLVAGDDNNAVDIFVKDIETKEVLLVSTDSDGIPANNHSGFARPAISADGRFVAFDSNASNLAYGDNNDIIDTFIKNLETGETIMVSTNSAGEAVSADGNLYDGSYFPSISADGHFVAFQSKVANLTSGDTNRASDVFVKDLQTGVTSIVSTDSSGNQGNGESGRPSISADGRYVSFASEASLTPGDNNEASDIFVKDRQTGQTRLVSSNSSGQGAVFGLGYRFSSKGSWSPFISADGRYVVFDSVATNLVNDDTNAASDIFKKDLLNGTTTRVSTSGFGEQTDGGGGADYYGSITPSISADGRYVAFISNSSSLSPNGESTSGQVFIKDTQTGYLNRLSVDADGIRARGECYGPFVSADGNFVSFGSEANNLVAGDGNSASDIFRAPAGSFAKPPAINYYFPWYDFVYGYTWVLTASPMGGKANSFEIWLKNNMLNSGQSIGAGDSKAFRFDGAIGGPVKVAAAEGKALVSERSLFGNSFEEIWATPYAELDSHYYWPAYLGAFLDEWILVSNPKENGEAVQVDLSMKTEGAPIFSQQIIQPGDSWTPIFPGRLGYAVEVKAYRVNGSPDNGSDARKVIASERILMHGAFNEMPGIPASKLSNRYFWTWYDSINSYDEIAIGNPNDWPVWVTIYIAGKNVSGAPHQIGPGDVGGWSSGEAQPIMDGPVEVVACHNDSVPCASYPADIYASQIMVYGPSYGEVAGIRDADLKPTANWTWYDQKSPGAQNWILIGNPNNYSIYYEIYLPGIDTAHDNRAHGSLGPNGRATPTFPGFMGGPLIVKAWSDASKAAPAPLMASQRVLWSGYFNEIVGKGS